MTSDIDALRMVIKVTLAEMGDQAQNPQAILDRLVRELEGLGPLLAGDAELEAIRALIVSVVQEHDPSNPANRPQ